MRFRLLNIFRSHLPRLATQILLLCLWFALSVMTFIGGLVSTSSYDEVYHEQYLRDDFLNFHSWISIRALTPRALDGSGNALEFLGHIVNVILGNDQWLTTVSATPSGVMGRHVIMSLLGIYASFLVFRTTKILTNNSLSSISAATSLLAIPMWSGSAFFNPKDTPIAFGLLGVIYIFTKLLKGGEIGIPCASSTLNDAIAENGFIKAWKSSLLKRRILAVLLSLEVVFFIFMGIGTRPGALSLLIAFYFGFSVILLLRKRVYEMAYLAILTIFGLLLSALVNPLSYSNPLAYFRDQMGISNHFSLWNGVNLVAGHLMRGQANSWWYEPAWILAQTPVLIEILILSGAAITLVGFFRSTTFKVSSFQTVYRKTLDSSRIAYLPALALFLLPLLYAVIFKPVLYNASRHLMMVYPAIAIFFGLAINRIAHKFSKAALKVATLGILTLALLAPSWEALRLFPYNYVYINPAARLFGTNGVWEFDYWKLSLPAALKMSPENTPVLVWPSTLPANLPNPYWIAGWIDPNYPPLPPTCRPIYITRPLGTKTINLSYMAVCTK